MVKKLNERNMSTYYDRYGWKQDLRTEKELYNWVRDAMGEIETDC